MKRNSFSIQFSKLPDSSNVFYLDDEGNEITRAVFSKELETGYRAGLLIIPNERAIQLQYAMMTPYHKDQFELDPGFVLANFNNYLTSNDIPEHMTLEEQDDTFFIGEIEID